MNSNLGISYSDTDVNTGKVSNIFPNISTQNSLPRSDLTTRKSNREIKNNKNGLYRHVLQQSGYQMVQRASGNDNESYLPQNQSRADGSYLVVNHDSIANVAEASEDNSTSITTQSLHQIPRSFHETHFITQNSVVYTSNTQPFSIENSINDNVTYRISSGSGRAPLMTTRQVTLNEWSLPMHEISNPALYSNPSPSVLKDQFTHKPNLDITSSGAFFDHGAILRGGYGSPSTSIVTEGSSDIIRQLTREMRNFSSVGSDLQNTRFSEESEAKAQLDGAEMSNNVPTRVALDVTELNEDDTRTDEENNSNLRLCNRKLRMELAEFGKKMSKVAVLESEVLKISEAYQSLLKHSEKREALEKSARIKLQSIIANLNAANKSLSERHDMVMMQLMSGEPKNQNIPGLDSILRGEIQRKDALIAQLMNQNKMFVGIKERQDVELMALNDTLEEQRSHISILDSALSEAQTTIVRMENELRLKQGYAERLSQMANSLEQLQAASEKREAMEKSLRSKLEADILTLRLNYNKRYPQAHFDENSEELHKKYLEAEEKVLLLEAERSEWERRYLDECHMNKIAWEEKNSKQVNSGENSAIDSESGIEQRKQHTQEMQCSQRKINELEEMMKILELKLAERTRMLRMWQTKQILTSQQNQSLSLDVQSNSILSIPVSPGPNWLSDRFNCSSHNRQLSTPLYDHAHQRSSPHLTTGVNNLSLFYRSTTIDPTVVGEEICLQRVSEPNISVPSRIMDASSNTLTTSTLSKYSSIGSVSRQGPNFTRPNLYVSTPPVYSSLVVNDDTITRQDAGSIYTGPSLSTTPKHMLIGSFDNTRLL